MREDREKDLVEPAPPMEEQKDPEEEEEVDEDLLLPDPEDPEEVEEVPEHQEISRSFSLLRGYLKGYPLRPETDHLSLMNSLLVRINFNSCCPEDNIPNSFRASSSSAATSEDSSMLDDCDTIFSAILVSLEYFYLEF